MSYDKVVEAYKRVLLDEKERRIVQFLTYPLKHLDLVKYDDFDGKAREDHVHQSSLMDQSHLKSYIPT